MDLHPNHKPETLDFKHHVGWNVNWIQELSNKLKVQFLGLNVCPVHNIDNLLSLVFLEALFGSFGCCFDVVGLRTFLHLLHMVQGVVQLQEARVQELQCLTTFQEISPKQCVHNAPNRVIQARLTPFLPIPCRTFQAMAYCSMSAASATVAGNFRARVCEHMILNASSIFDL